MFGTTCSVALAMVALLTATAAEPLEGGHFLSLSENSNYDLAWKVDPSKITFEITVVNNGNWFGFGLNSLADMPGADIVTFEPSGGTVALTDCHSTGQEKPVKDPVQDYTLISSVTTAGTTVTRFSRPLALCEGGFDYTITRGTVSVLFAIGSGPTVAYHGANTGATQTHGAKSTSLLMPVPTQTFEKAQSFKLNHSASIGATRTSYYCVAKKVPDVFGDGKAFHSVGWKPDFGTEGGALLHHVLMYNCPSLSSSGASEQNWAGECRGGNMPSIHNDCRDTGPIFGWAAGGRETAMPKDVGILMTPGSYLVLEMHLDNPLQTAQNWAGLGLTLFAEPKRQYDAAMFELGAKVDGHSMMIPPGQRSFDITGYCPGFCLSSMVGKKIFGGFLHAHLTGIAVKTTKVDSSGVETPVLTDTSYDFNYQHISLLNEQIEIKTGDQFVTTCTHRTDAVHENKLNDRGNAVDYSQPVFAGEPSTSEMCLTYLYYYPALPTSGPKSGRSLCRSRVKMLTSDKSVKNNYNLALGNGAGGIFADNWAVSQRTKMHETQCAKSNYTQYEDVDGFAMVKTPWKPKSNCPKVLEPPMKMLKPPCRDDDAGMKIILELSKLPVKTCAQSTSDCSTSTIITGYCPVACNTGCTVQKKVWSKEISWTGVGGTGEASTRAVKSFQNLFDAATGLTSTVQTVGEVIKVSVDDTTGAHFDAITEATRDDQIAAMVSAASAVNDYGPNSYASICVPAVLSVFATSLLAVF